MLSNSHSTNELRKDIAQRLEKLNKWQEEQKKMLQERQDMQRQMLGMEQRKLYEMLGIDSPTLEDISHDPAKDEECNEDQEINTLVNNNSEIQDEPRDSLTYDSNNTCTDAQRKTSGYCTDEMQETEAQIVNKNLVSKIKRSFLRRGEGLKQRFKIDPDALRLNNLPKYKYANAHPQFFKNLRKKRTNQKTSLPPDNQLPKNSENKLESEKIRDAQEERFQQLLLSSHNTCNSTPDMKSSNGTNSNSNSSTHLPKVRFVEISTVKASETNKESKSNADISPMATAVPSVTWARVLDTQQIKPISVQQIRHQYQKNSYQADKNESDSNLSLFELLEKKANEGSIDMNSTCIRQFMLKRMNKENESVDPNEIPVPHDLKKTAFLPQVTTESTLCLSELEDERDETAERINEDENTMTPNKLSSCERSQLQVRFCDDNSLENAEESCVYVAEESSSLHMFAQFKEALFAALQSKEEAYNTTVSNNESEINRHQLSSLKEASPNLTLDLKTKMNLVKTRLEELEKEIASFKENNVNLIKAKQDHELEKAQFTEERLEAMEKLNDAKIQMEIYLHDERMKIEDEKRNFERHMQMLKTTTNSKDKKEIARLQQELEELKSQLKVKEQTHVAAQARLRAQIRNMEKEQKELYDDIERLTKENKRLQNENMKISRENNNKMLQEINRNIAKLAPKLASTTNNNGDVTSYPTELPVAKTAKVKSSKNMQKAKHSRHNINKTDKVKTNSALVNTDTSSDNDEDHKLKLNINPKLSNKVSCDDDIDDISKELKIADPSSKNKNQPNIDKQTKKVIDANKSSIAADFKREIINSDGSKDIWYPNGNLKKISADGMNIRMLYFNKDIKETNINEGTVKYYYAETNTWHTTYLDGLEILEFPNGQTEHRYKNGVVEVHFPNNSIKITNPADEHKLEEWRFADGTNLIQMRNGDKILIFSNGQKEIHTKLNKRREYPDGTVKIVYPDGSQETRYSNGRVRLKDKGGKLVMDTENAI